MWDDFVLRLSLAELEAFTRLGLTVLLALRHPGITSQHANFLEGATQSLVVPHQSSCNGKSECTGLSAHPTATDLGDDVELILPVYDLEGFANMTKMAQARKIILKSPAVYMMLPGATHQANTCHGHLATADDRFLCCCYQMLPP